MAAASVSTAADSKNADVVFIVFLPDCFFFWIA
jgi:hypothetical protein